MKRFTITETGYKYDKLIFWLIISFWLAIFGLLAYENDFNFSNKFYLNCPGPEPCRNPLVYDENGNFLTTEAIKNCDADYCREAWLMPGEYGNPPPKYFSWLPWVVTLSVLIGIFFNHFIYNQGKNIDLTLNVPESWKRR